MVLYTYPPLKPQLWYGYRSPQSLSSPVKWGIANRLAPLYMLATVVVTSLYVYSSSSPEVYETATELLIVGVFVLIAGVEATMYVQGDVSA